MIEELYKRKVIRDFLSLFAEKKWKLIISSILEYGILILKQNHNLAALTLEDLCKITLDLKHAMNIMQEPRSKRSSSKSVNKGKLNSSSVSKEKKLKFVKKASILKTSTTQNKVKPAGKKEIAKKTNIESKTFDNFEKRRSETPSKKFVKSSLYSITTKSNIAKKPQVKKNTSTRLNNYKNSTASKITKKVDSDNEDLKKPLFKRTKPSSSKLNKSQISESNAYTNVKSRIKEKIDSDKQKYNSTLDDSKVATIQNIEVLENASRKPELTYIASAKENHIYSSVNCDPGLNSLEPSKTSQMNCKVKEENFSNEIISPTKASIEAMRQELSRYQEYFEDISRDEAPYLSQNLVNSHQQSNNNSGDEDYMDEQQINLDSNEC